ncbi:MAG: ORF6N domain-containing protein [Bacteroidia bacterium]|jgi:hypothetical protein
MTKKSKMIAIPDEAVMNKILVIRGQKVMIDRDMAELYGTTTVRLNEQVRRNASRFPGDFMFRITEKEKKEVIAICDNLQSLRFSAHLPFVFTEHGAVMLASVLNSEKAVRMNIQIVRVFIKMREMMTTHKNILKKVDNIERKQKKQDAEVKALFEYIRQFVSGENNRKVVGYKFPTKNK